jgi:hypothetical protein
MSFLSARRTWAFTACLVAWPLLGRTGERETAVELSREATQAYKAGNYAVALQKFEAAYRAFPAPAVVVNLSRTELRLRHCQKALDYAQTYGEAFGQSSTASIETPAALLASVQAECPEVSITSEPPGATIIVEGVPDATFVTPWRGRLPTGSFNITAKLAGAPDQHPPLTVASGALSQLHLTFSVAPPPPVVAVTTPAASQQAAAVPATTAAAPPIVAATAAPVVLLQPPPPEGHPLPAAMAEPHPQKNGHENPTLRKVGWAGLAVGAATLAAGLGLGIAGYMNQTSVHTMAHPGLEAFNILNTGNTEVTAANVCFGAGGVLGAAGAAMVVVF